MIRIGYFTAARRHIARYREVANILSRHGFGLVLDRLGLYRFVPFPRRVFRLSPSGRAPLPPPERLRLALEELGPTAVKFGQMLSTRPDLLPPQFIRELEKLQDAVPPFSQAEVRALVEAELGIRPEEIFAAFEPEPLAAASLAQVHQAKLWGGEEVVVKIQRPGVEQKIETDLEILRELAQFTERHSDWGKLYRPTEIVEEFAHTVHEELDFKNEGRNIEQFRRNFADDPSVYIPKVYWKYTSRRILILERLQGIKISNLDQLEASGLDRRTIAANLARAILRQILIHGFFHADPHPGNILVTGDGTIVFMDFGMVGCLDEDMKRKLVEIVRALEYRDVDRIAQGLLEIGLVPLQIELRALRYDIARLLRRYYNVPLSQIPIGQCLNEAFSLAYKYQVRIPPELVRLARTLVILESVTMQLDPELSIVDVAEPFGRELLRQRFSSRRLRESFTRSFAELATLVETLPWGINQLTRLLENGELRLRLEPVTQQPPPRENLGSRLALALVTAAGIFGSVLLIQIDKGPALWGMSIFGLIGLAASALLALWLVALIALSRRP